MKLFQDSILGPKNFYLTNISEYQRPKYITFSYLLYKVYLIEDYILSEMYCNFLRIVEHICDFLNISIQFLDLSIYYVTSFNGILYQFQPHHKKLHSLILVLILHILFNRLAYVHKRTTKACCASLHLLYIDPSLLVETLNKMNYQTKHESLV